MKKICCFLTILVLLFLSSCDKSKPTYPAVLPSLPAGFPKIDHEPATADYQRSKLSEVPSYDPESDQQWQMDLRSYDLSNLDLTKSLSDLLFSSFDTKTIWPVADKMPPNFYWEKIMELGKNPGLGIHKLHSQGVTGSGVGIAIIDQPLLVNHIEYADQLRLYEEADDIKSIDSAASMHGGAVASIAVGKTVGVAPAADLYFIATNLCSKGGFDTIDYSCLAKNVRRILEINNQLPEGRKIRVLSMSIGWMPDRIGYEGIKEAAQEARETGMLVICSSVEEVHGFKFHALGRPPLADPDSFQSYEPGLWWAKGFYDGDQFSDRLLVPMDSRTTASPTGVEDYVFYREGGWSWSIPYIAGVYALAAQVKPNITPDEFWSLAMKTGQTIELNHDGTVIPFGPIIDPVALISALQSE